MFSAADIQQFNDEHSDALPKEILKAVCTSDRSCVLSFSGADDVVLIDMAVKLGLNIKVMTIDTGRLHPETYRFIEEVRNHYNLEIDIAFPDEKRLSNLIKNKGLYSFYTDGHEECCEIRKVEPLQRYLAAADIWITGQRQDQSPSRADVPIMQWDNTIGKADSSLIKLNPLSNWSSSDVWSYIRMLELPYNELHDKGFVSIGCEPCTRSVGPGQHEREGRWWWEEATLKECGLHLANISD